MRLAEEVGGVDAEVLEAAADVGVGATGPFDAEAAQDVGDAEGIGRRRREEFAGVLLVAGHGARVEGGTDISPAAGMRRGMCQKMSQ
ncbi:hypothetical protein [Spongiactinospora sp. TRM90649]|uniref:hypothetical protein n=1 Tax=Spongiactinospora sp. TRM90649 TaxID=3031114 RepID=UPI0023F9B491|nr:hypothetical protein [Spongiactinospora sp. TRM90649]MDF5752625.1 hypothetical protein [Spongiactinospora sp. TRM90649]